MNILKEVITIIDTVVIIAELTSLNVVLMCLTLVVINFGGFFINKLV